MFYKLAKVLSTALLITQPLMAEVVFPVDYPFNPTTTEEIPAALRIPKRILQKSTNHIYNALKNSPDWIDLNKELKAKILKNRNNFAQVSFDMYSFYWDKENGVHIVGGGLKSPSIHFQRTKLNYPEDMAFELQRTAAINKNTKRPYFELTPQFLQTLETQTNTQLSTEQRHWLNDYAAVLNENFHFFYGERFFWFHDVIKEVEYRNLMGRYYPIKFFLRAEQELFIPSVEQEANFLYLKLIDVLPKKQQIEVLKKLVDLPKDKKTREKLLNDTERLLTEPGMKKYSKVVVNAVKELKNHRLPTVRKQVLLHSLLPIIEKSRFKYELHSRYIHPSPDTLKYITKLLPDNHKALAQQVSHDLERIDEIYENKMEIGMIIGRPVYNLDKVFVNRPCTLLGSMCHGFTTTRVLLPDIGAIEVASPDAHKAGDINILNARSSQMEQIGPCFLEMMKDIDYLAKEHHVYLDDIHANKTAFSLAMAHLSCQAIAACHQVLESDYANNFLFKENIEFMMSKSGRHGTDIGKERSLAEAIPLKPYDPTQMDGVRFIKSSTSKK